MNLRRIAQLRRGIRVGARRDRRVLLRADDAVRVRLARPRARVRQMHERPHVFPSRVSVRPGVARVRIVHFLKISARIPRVIMHAVGRRRIRVRITRPVRVLLVRTELMKEHRHVQRQRPVRRPREVRLRLRLKHLRQLRLVSLVHRHVRRVRHHDQRLLRPRRRVASSAQRRSRLDRHRVRRPRGPFRERERRDDDRDDRARASRASRVPSRAHRPRARVGGRRDSRASLRNVARTPGGVARSTVDANLATVRSGCESTFSAAPRRAETREDETTRDDARHSATTTTTT